MLAKAPDLFLRLVWLAGSQEGARTLFQTMVTDLVGVSHPTANEVAAPSGSDWGIDTYVGELDVETFVWQSKYFLQWTGETQRGQVRGSFNEVQRKAKETGFSVRSWILCVPCVLPPEEQQWFDKWAKRMQREHGCAIALWNGVELRRRLLQPDAEQIRKHYFTDDSSTASEPSEAVASVPDLSNLTTSLFIRQLNEAGQVETDAAKAHFFVAEALVRDIAARGSSAGISGVEELHLELHALWELTFNDALRSADADGIIAGIVGQVLSEAARTADPEGIRLRPAHKRGVVHRLVEDRRAGWVRHWRSVAESYDGQPTQDTIHALMASRTVRSGS